MKIVIDGRSILDPTYGEYAGVGQYTYHILKNLLAIDAKNQYVLFLNKKNRQQGEWDYPNVSIRTFPAGKIPFLSSHLIFARMIEQEKPDVYHQPANIIPFFYRGAAVVTFHDLAIYKHPEWFPSAQFVSKNILVPQSLKKAKKIIVPSLHTQKDIEEIFSIPAEKIRVIPHGITTQEGAHALDEKGSWKFQKPYVLFIGTIEPRKNIPALIEACDELFQKAPFQSHHLVIAGKLGWKAEAFLEKMKNVRSKNNIHYIGYVTEQQKDALLNNAECFVFPSWYEGFGLPVIEAMSAGAPVITSDNSSLSEIAREAAILLSIPSKEEIQKSLERILSDTNVRKDLQQKGLQRAKMFTWEKAAQETLKVYQEVGEKA